MLSCLVKYIVIYNKLLLDWLRIIYYVFYYYFLFYCFKGSSHSDKEVDPNTPEKLPRTPSERKRKRKADDSGGGGGGGVVGVVGGVSVGVGGVVVGGVGVGVVPPVKGVRTTTSDKKINDYFKHSGNSPIRHGGAKSPSPQQPYPMVRELLLFFFILIWYLIISLLYY